MADTGFSWSVYAAMQKGDADWTADALQDAGYETGDATSLDGKAACEVSIGLVEDNTGAIAGDITVYVLGDIDGTNYEEVNSETGASVAWSFSVTPIQNDTVFKRFSIDPGQFGSFKLALWNDSEQEVAVTVKYRTATIPAAS